MRDGVRDGIISTVAGGEQNPVISGTTHVNNSRQHTPPTVSSLSHLEGGGGSVHRPYLGDGFLSSHPHCYRNGNRFPNITLDAW